MAEARPRQVVAWGRLRRPMIPVAAPAFMDEALPALRPVGPQLCLGLGRSYGDVGQNSTGRQVAMAGLDRLISADWETGVVRAEAGMSLAELIRVALPHGWFPAVVPGTKFVTLGGAVANDVHGKNHRAAGTFGRHVRRLGLWRSDRGEITLSAEHESGLFAATIAGLGLTGAILWVELALRRVPSAFLETETFALDDLDAYFEAMRTSTDWEYRVAWIDCLAKGAGVGRGLFTRARHAPSGGHAPHRAPRLAMPVEAPGWLLSRPTVQAFNALYRWRPWARGPATQHYDPSFFPLDAMAGWNRMYGRRGFYQHQSALPKDAAPLALRQLLEACAEAGQASFLVVLKEFGPLRSPGLLSFPLDGSTLALDLPNAGESTRRLLNRLAGIALDAGGRIYPAKDAIMNGAQLRISFPGWEAFQAWRDPAFDSDFARRAAADAG